MKERRSLLRGWLPLLLLLMSEITRTESNPVGQLKQEEVDNAQNRKLLGSSVVTSVSVIMEHGNGTKTYITDNYQPVAVKPEVVGTPGTLMSPDRYEFYSFGKDGELVKKLMTLEEIQGLIAGGDELSSSEEGLPVYYHQPLIEAGEPEGVSKVLESVQNVLKGELQSTHPPVDVSPMPLESWSILLPGLLNSEIDFKEPLLNKLISTTRPASKTTTTTGTTTTTTPVPSTTAKPVPTVRVTPRNPTKKPNPIKQTTLPTTKRPLSTIKYSAHYSTASPQIVKTTERPLKPASFTKKPTLTTVKRPAESTTSKPTTQTRVQTHEKTKPSGIPTIIHYLPIQSASPSDAPSKVPVKTTVKGSNSTTTVFPSRVTSPSTLSPSPVRIAATDSTAKPSPVVGTTAHPSSPSKPSQQPLAQKLVSSSVKPSLNVEAQSSNLEKITIKPPSNNTKPISATPDTFSNSHQQSQFTTTTTVRTTPVKTKQPVTVKIQMTTPAPPLPSTTTKLLEKVKLSSSSSLLSLKTTKGTTTTRATTTTTTTSTTPTPPASSPATPSTGTTATKSAQVVSTSPILPPATTSTTTPLNVPRITTTTTSTPMSTTITSTASSPPVELKSEKPLRPTTQAVDETRKPTTSSLVTSVTSTVTSTGPPSTTLEESTMGTTLGALMEEIPLKLAENLKQPVKNVFDSVIASTMLTTATMEPFITTDLTTTPSPTTSTNPSTTKMVIVNNSEPKPFSNQEPLIAQPSQDRTSSIAVTEQSTETPSSTMKTVPTMMTSTESEMMTTTLAASTTSDYKDQIMAEGISAVTNILLNQAEKVLPPGVDKQQPVSTTVQQDTSSMTTTEGTTETSLMAEMRKDPIGAELRTNGITADFATTTTADVAMTTTDSGFNFESKNKSRTEALNATLPTKESKLSAESVDNAEQKNTTESTTVEVKIVQEASILSTTTPTFHEVALQEAEKSAPGKPLGVSQEASLNKYMLKKPGFIAETAPPPPPAIELHPAPYESMGLEASTAFLGEDVRRFADLCNELAFRLWTSLTGKGHISSRSMVVSPFGAMSLLAMVFLGARGSTSGQMNEILRLDDMVTFNPHQVLQNVTESILSTKNNGVATAAFVRELYSDKSKGRILDFYKERVQQYYQGHVEEINFGTIGDIIRRRTNLLVKRQTQGKIPEYLRGSSLTMRPPLAAFSANVFQTDCENASTEGRDGEMYFVVRPSTRQRRLVPVPAVVWRGGFLAGYEPSLDATSVCLGADSLVSTLLILPGQQGQVAPGDGLARLEQRLIETSYRRGGWSRLLRSLLLRPGLELQVPRFSHRSVLNITSALSRMGLRDLFNDNADLRGLNGGGIELHLSEMLQVNTFSTCGEENIGARHHIETYPASPQRMGRRRIEDDDDDDSEDASESDHLRHRYYSQSEEDWAAPSTHPPPHYSSRRSSRYFFTSTTTTGQPNYPLVRKRQSRLPDSPRLRFDRPFLYVVRHNPSGMILHIGRFNPRLLP